ncbi:ribosome maturation factor RimP [Yunchengibacter salinarum]|uniref:ribosome maturation factor RimP n=1 Tax=Yunchengibacter salinarum TaxID=3133399 RepID=UPI0035B5B666
MKGLDPLSERIATLIGPVVEDLGYELVRVTYGGGRKPTLQVMAERPDGTMNVDDCATVSREVSALLDVEDPIGGEYLLEVSSPGIDRPLTRMKDFARWQGFDVKVEMTEKVGERRRFRGRLTHVGDGTVTVETEDLGPVTLNYEDMAKAKLVLTDALIEAAGKAGG